MKLYPDYSFEITIENDNNWLIYQEKLFPTPNLLQMLYNQRLISELRKKGDNPEKLRDILHTLTFSSSKERSAFMTKVKSLKFTEVKSYEDANNPEFTYVLIISKPNKTTEKELNDCCIMLLETVSDLNGVYVGWQTNVSK